MDGRSKAISTRARGFWARLAIALCLLVFGVGDAVERSLGGHLGPDAALAHAVSADLSTDHSGLHVDDQSGDRDAGGQIVGHGCHGCAALPEQLVQLVVSPPAGASTLAWASSPSAAGREPLVDLPPPRA